MSASIAVLCSDNNQLFIPIKAVKQEKDQAVVKVQALDGSLSKRIVSTGSARADHVMITAGLKAGETVVYETVN